MSERVQSHLANSREGQTSERSKEFALLCACAQVDLQPETIAYLANVDLLEIDWPLLLRSAEHHGILPLVARNLGAHARGLPLEIERTLRSAYEMNVRRSLWFATELRRISDRLNKNNLRAVPYKGPALADSAYGDVGLRSFSDLDFLISPSTFERAKRALAELGYRPSVEFSPAIDRFSLRMGYERSFDSEAGKNLVELQWSLLPYFYAVDLRMDDLLARSRQTSTDGRNVFSLSPEDSLLVLCLHAAKHLWTRLIWVCDVAETLRAETIDYPLLVERSWSLGILRIVGVCSWLANHLLGQQVPQPLQQIIAGDSQVALLGQQFASRLARNATYELECSEYFRLMLRLRERPTDRWRYLWRLVWTPGAGDLASIRLPEVLFPLYRVVRMTRLFRKLPRL